MSYTLLDVDIIYSHKLVCRPINVIQRTIALQIEKQSHRIASHRITSSLLAVGGTGLLAGDAPDGVHVVVAHVGAVGGLVLGAAGVGQILANGDGDVREDGEEDRESNDGLPRWHLVDLLHPGRGGAALHAVGGTVEARPRTERRGLVEDAHEAGEGAVHLGVLIGFNLPECKRCCVAPTDGEMGGRGQSRGGWE